MSNDNDVQRENLFPPGLARPGGHWTTVTTARPGKLDPQNAFFQPEEIASSVLYLASDESRHVNGSVLVLNRLAAG